MNVGIEDELGSKAQGYMNYIEIVPELFGERHDWVDKEAIIF